MLPSNQRWFPAGVGGRWDYEGRRDGTPLADVEGPSTNLSHSRTMSLLLWCCLGGRLTAQSGFSGQLHTMVGLEWDGGSSWVDVVLVLWSLM